MEDIVNRIKEFEGTLSRVIPDTLIIPGVVRQWLYEQGYETEEQVVELVKSNGRQVTNASDSFLNGC